MWRCAVVGYDGVLYWDMEMCSLGFGHMIYWDVWGCSILGYKVVLYWDWDGEREREREREREF